ncbi:aldo/keto reductase [Parashewanella spongiae]|uniref:Aldo/keto reductase n=1 Tax=Parashewanella spongiae TaxID=342950 RepID=A0A3A6UA86_9GAMM|nr:aldo/keto reductase [Parashewanella spongiae]MCL1077941.1 aldo/keto reductase [Parashewanella spongiae]RJY18439.1 aldo/keto reductase [Parashewanella spongiae]
MNIMCENPVVAKKQLKLPTLGFGGAPLGNLYRPIADQDARALLETAWNSNFRHFDTAPHYGQGLSERRIGDFLRQHSAEEYVLSTKVGRLLKPAGSRTHRHGFFSPMPFDIEYDYSYDGVMRSFEDSLQRLGLDKIDILYMHDIGRLTHGDKNEGLFFQAMTGGYKALDSLRKQGVIKAFGLGVNEYQVCEEALDFGDWDCFLLAGRYTLLEQEANQHFLPKCLERNCSIILGGPYNSGILATGTRTNSPLYYDYAPASKAVIDKVKQLEAICDEYQVPLAAAALQFPIAHPAVVSVIPGLGELKRIQQSIDLFNYNIPSQFWQTIREQGLVTETSPLFGDL